MMRPRSMYGITPFLGLLTATGVDALSRGEGSPVTSQSPTSSVAGKYFDRFVQIWLENTDYAKAAGDPNLAWLASRGVSLTNYFAVTHPSQPNYVAAVGGDYFGLNSNDYIEIPSNISTVVDLLEDRGITWGNYQESMPYTGFTGVEFLNPIKKSNMYVRKHNPLVSYLSAAGSEARLALMKNETEFHADVAAHTLPQWVFFTPNMTSNGHDTSVTTAGEWAHTFLEPLLENAYFTDRTLVLLTFDENHSYPAPNRVFTVLLGGAIPKSRHATEDPAYYDHYSSLATVQANWDLHSLGRYDVGANVFGPLSPDPPPPKTHAHLDGLYMNVSYPGVFHRSDWVPMPLPNISLVRDGRSVLPGIVEAWKSVVGETVYNGSLEEPDGLHPPSGGAAAAAAEGVRVRVRWWGLWGVVVAVGGWAML